MINNSNWRTNVLHGDDESTRKQEVELSNYHKGDAKTSLLERKEVSNKDELIRFVIKLGEHVT